MKMAMLAAVDAGAEILSIYNNGVPDVEFDLKSDNSPVTIADILSNDIIVERLSKTGINIVSEELPLPPSEERGQMSKFWIIDPLDGTKEFLNKTGEFTVNIALVENDRAVLGVLFVPCQDLLYFGMVGFGAYIVKGAKLNVDMSLAEMVNLAEVLPNAPKRDSFIIAKSVSFTDSETNKYIDDLFHKYQQSEVKPIGSSLKFAKVASGEIDCYPRLSVIHEWDIAAGIAIVFASGGVVLDLSTGAEILLNDSKFMAKKFVCWSK